MTLLTHKWSIDNFLYLYNRDKFPNSTDFYVESEVFPSTNEDDPKFSLQLHPNGLKGQSKFTSLIFVNHEDSNFNFANEKFSLQVSILNDDESEDKTFSKETKHKFSSTSNKCKIENFVERDFLLKLDKLVLEIKIVSVKWQLSFLNSSQKSSVESTSSSFNPKIESIGFEWTIFNFQDFLLNDQPRKSNQFYIDSELFSPNSNLNLTVSKNPTKFHLRLYPLGEKERLFMGLFLCQENLKNEIYDKIRFKLSILDSKGEKRNLLDKEEEFKEIGYGFAKFISHYQLKSLMIFDDLKLFCQVEIMDQNLTKIDQENYQRIFKNKNSTDIPSIESSFDVQLHTVPFAYQWTIDNYSEHKKVKSEKFSPPNNQNLKFYIKIYPKGQCRKNRGFLSVYLGLKTSEPVKALYKFSLLNCGEIGTKLNSKASVASFDRKFQWFGFPQYVPIFDLEKMVCKSGRMIVLCEVELIIDSDEKISPVNLQNYSNIFESKISYLVTPALGCHFAVKRSDSKLCGLIA